VDCSRPPVFTNEQAGCRHHEANDSLPRETIGRESCSCRPTAILQILPDKPLAFIFQAADEHCALRQQDIELVHQVQNRQLVPTYVGALHNSRMSNDTDATARREMYCNKNQSAVPDQKTDEFKSDTHTAEQPPQPSPVFDLEKKEPF
jgi:hypothetical protein